MPARRGGNPPEGSQGLLAKMLWKLAMESDTTQHLGRLVRRGQPVQRHAQGLHVLDCVAEDEDKRSLP